MSSEDSGPEEGLGQTPALGEDFDLAGREGVEGDAGEEFEAGAVAGFDELLDPVEGWLKVFESGDSAFGALASLRVDVDEPRREVGLGDICSDGGATCILGGHPGANGVEIAGGDWDGCVAQGHGVGADAGAEVEDGVI